MIELNTAAATSRNRLIAGAFSSQQNKVHARNSVAEIPHADISRPKPEASQLPASEDQSFRKRPPEPSFNVNLSKDAQQFLGDKPIGGHRIGATPPPPPPPSQTDQQISILTEYDNFEDDDYSPLEILQGGSKLQEHLSDRDFRISLRQGSTESNIRNERQFRVQNDQLRTLDAIPQSPSYETLRGSVLDISG